MELYVHIPFCARKCRYCSFVSYAAEKSEHEAYITLLLREASQRCTEAEEPIRTVYIGGGTPSLLSPAMFRQLADGLNRILGLNSVEEFTSEANPGTVTREWLDTAVSVGVNRISFGMQACQDHLLRILGRIHHFQDVCRSVQLARESGIENINLDLIFGLPGQRMKDWMESLEAALSLHPEHISAYGLIPEEGTPLFEDLKNGGLSLPDPEDERQMYWNAVRILREYGYDQYEISNFARKGYECRHNIGYWTQIPYIGLGVSAASMVHLRTGTGGMTCIRRVNPSSQEAYIRLTETDYSGVSVEKIAPHESRFETLMLGLRMNDGISEEGFLRLHGVPVDKYYGSRLNDMERKGLMIHKNGRWRMTERGFDIQNSILVELMD